MSCLPVVIWLHGKTQLLLQTPFSTVYVNESSSPTKVLDAWRTPACNKLVGLLKSLHVGVFIAAVLCRDLWFSELPSG